jgi:hypothetical protein
MAKETPSANPYQPPRVPDSIAPDGAAYPRAVVTIYWWVGVLGLAFYAIFGATLLYAAVTEWRRWKWNDALPLAVNLAIGVAFFAACVVVGNRLTTQPAHIRRPARWLGFIMAIYFFPILTIPGLLAVWKLDKFFEGDSASNAATR